MKKIFSLVTSSDNADRHVTKRNMLVMLVVITAILAASVTVAYMFKKSKPLLNNFEKATINCAVEEQFDYPTKDRITVVNTGTTEAYLRVKLVSYWTDESGEIVGLAAEPITALCDASFWLEGEDNTYYYRKPVGEGERTSVLFPAPITLAEKTVEGETYYQAIDVFAEAIQAKPEEAVQNSWRVTVNAAGEITGQ